MATTSEGNGKSVDISVKFAGKSIRVTAPCDSTVKDLKSLLQPLTNVLPRGQKLIFKGFGFCLSMYVHAFCGRNLSERGGFGFFFF